MSSSGVKVEMLIAIVDTLADRFSREPTVYEVTQFVNGDTDVRRRIWDERGLRETFRYPL
jgi:hypothetical protein